MTEPLTRTGSIREGFEYQDLYGVAISIEWLEHPERYDWVTFEEDEFGFLDDVVRCTPDLKITLSQIKHSGLPGPSRLDFSLSELLDKPQGKTKSKDSLLQKWLTSWVGVVGQQRFSEVRAELLTNRTAADSLLRLMKKDSNTGILSLDANKLKSNAPDEWTALLEQAGANASLVEAFLDSLSFRFDYLEIEVQRAALSLRAQALGISPSGFRDLEDATRKWAKRRHAAGVIRFTDIRTAAAWNAPQPLNQLFLLPKDFVQVGPELVHDLLEMFRDITGGAILIHGTPGAGKSTFLGSLYQHAKDAGIHCIRHHYFIHRDDPERSKRLEFEAASESILSELINEVAESLPNLNPEPVRFARILHDVALSLAEKKQTLVLIVDGLDEVERSASALELQRFLRDLFPIGTGLWIVFGTRPLHEQKLSFLLSDIVPEQHRIPVPLFDRATCEQLIEANSDWLKVHEHELEELVWRFREATQGHPLHCRYVLEALKQQGEYSQFRSSDIARIPPFGRDLEDFYSRLWLDTDEAAKEIASLLALASFPVRSAEIVNILESESVSGSQLLRGLVALRPFVNEDSQKLELFHTSFGEFIRRTNEYEALEGLLLRKLADWLKDKGPENLQWAHLNRILYFQGNPEPLLQTVTRRWLIQAVVDARPPDQIIDQIEWATHAAMEKGVFDAALCAGQLGLYLQDSWRSNEELWDSIDVLARRLKTGTSIDRLALETEVQVRSPKFLTELGADLALTGDTDTLKRMISELNSRFSHKRRSMLGRVGGEDEKNARALIVTAAQARVSHERVLNFISAVNDVGAARLLLLDTYFDILIENKQATILKRILAASEWQETHATVVDRICRAALLSGNPPLIVTDLQAKGPWRRLYGALVERTAAFLLNLPPASGLPLTAKEYDTSEESRITLLFLDVYREGMIAGAQELSSVFQEWLQSLDKDTWSHQAIGAVGQLGFNHGSFLSKSASTVMDKPWTPLTNVPLCLFPEHREWWGIAKAYRKALIEICCIFASLQMRQQAQCLDSAFLEGLRSINELNGSYGITEILLRVTPTVLSGSAVAKFLEEDAEERVDRIEPFPERAEHYMNLGTIAYRAGLQELCEVQLRLAISNALGYGYHKDMAIYLNVESMSRCGEAGSAKVRGWLSRVTPIAKQAGKFTDGDETSNAILQVADACERACPRVLHSMYVGLCAEEEFYWADEIFAKLLRIADLTDPFEAALAATSIDNASQAVLAERASSGDGQAEAIWNRIKSAALPDVIGFAAPSGHTRATEEPQRHSQIDLEPEHIGAYLSKLDPPYDQQTFSRNWFARQVESGNAETAYKTLQDWMRERDYYLVDGGLLLDMVPFAEEFDGREEGFQCLCRAATEFYAWSPFAFSPKDRDRVWTELQRRYPDKWSEYIYWTCKTSKYGTPLRKMTYIPATPGAEFLLRFGQSARAEALVEADLGFVEQLMANLTVPVVEWFESSHTALDSLIARAFWIGPLVRERVSGQLAELLLNPKTEEATSSVLLKGLSEELLESRTVIWILPMARASRKGWNPPSADRLEKAIKSPSILSALLLAEL